MKALVLLPGPPIGVTGRETTPLLPDVPTVAESGIADFDITSWFGVVAPKGTPQAIVNRMAELIKEADQDPETRKKIMLLGATPAYLEPARFGQFIADEVKNGDRSWRTQAFPRNNRRRFLTRSRYRSERSRPLLWESIRA